MLAPWKTASQTIHARLREYDESRYPRFFYFNRHLNRVVHQHITRAEFNCLPEAKLGYLTAAFVRNPYDRAYSGFRQLQEDIRNQPSEFFPEQWIRDLVRKQLADNLVQLRQAGFQFDAWLALIGDEQIYEVGRNSSFPLHPSHYWTHIADAKAVDFIGRVEMFEGDFQRFLSQVGIQQLQQVNKNVYDLMGDSCSNPFGYRYVAQINARSRARINELFDKDFELFGYEKIS
jgi:hypothetical protein